MPMFGFDEPHPVDNKFAECLKKTPKLELLRVFTGNYFGGYQSLEFTFLRDTLMHLRLLELGAHRTGHITWDCVASIATLPMLEDLIISSSQDWHLDSPAVQAFAKFASLKRFACRSYHECLFSMKDVVLILGSLSKLNLEFYAFNVTTWTEFDEFTERMERYLEERGKPLTTTFQCEYIYERNGNDNHLDDDFVPKHIRNYNGHIDEFRSPHLHAEYFRKWNGLPYHGIGRRATLA